MSDIGPRAEQHIRPPGWYSVERGMWVWLAPPETPSRARVRLYQGRDRVTGRAAPRHDGQGERWAP